MDSRNNQSAHFEYLRKSAKALLKDLKKRDPASLARMASVKNVPSEDIQLADAQYLIAVESGFKSWADLKKHTDTRSKELHRALHDLREGRACILFDDEGRENEGDFIVSAEKATADHINFITKNGRGTVCAAVDNSIALQLGLTSSKSQNSSSDEPNFAQSLDAVTTSTGISAKDRAATVKAIAENSAVPSDFRSPGHIATLIEAEGGLTARLGHTEGSVHLMRKAGLRPAALICEILSDDGSMAGWNELQKIAQTYQLACIRMSDLRF